MDELIGIRADELEELRTLRRRVATAAALLPSPQLSPRLGELALVGGSAAAAFAAMSLRPYLTPRQLQRLAGLTNATLGRVGGSVTEGTSGPEGWDVVVPADASEADACAVWGLAVLAATVAKLSASVDDAVWLLPFVSGRDRLANACHAAQYVVTMCGVAAVGSWVGTMGAAYARGALLDERSLALLSGGALTLYACALFRGWWNERRRTRAAGSAASASSRGAGLGLERAVARPTLSTASVAANGAPDELSAWQLLRVSLLGAMDDLAMHVSLLLGRVLSPLQLVAGVAVGSLLVTLFCTLTSRSHAMMQRVQAVPLFAVVAAFATYTLLDVTL